MKAKRVGLLGWPLGHSISPAMHNAAFEALGLDWRYDLVPLESSAIIHEFGKLLDAGYVGFNVTVPYKRALLATIGRIQPDEAVLHIGAANTIKVEEDGRLTASNTDWRGFRDDLHAQGINPAEMHCLILGTGGSSRAVAYALRGENADRIQFVSRQPDPDRVDHLSYEHLHGVEADLIINCTPVGMAPHVAASPWPEDVALPTGAIIYDLIYNPAETRLMQQAMKSGLRAIGGLNMLIRQGALSFEQWTGQPAPTEIMTKAAKTALIKQTKERKG